MLLKIKNEKQLILFILDAVFKAKAFILKTALIPFP